MNNSLQIFNNEEFGSIRTLEENGKVLFCGSDVAKALGYANIQQAIRTNCKEDGCYMVAVTDNLGREQQAKFITEGNVYRLITHSKLPAAEKFESWVFDEVLPTIRKTGGYVADDEKFIGMYLPNADEATRLMFKTNLEAIRSLNHKVGLLETENAQQKQIIGELKPRADYTDRILSNKGLVTITQIAKDYGMSGRKMNKLLEDLGVQYKQSGQWLLKAKYHDKGYTHSKTINITRKDGTPDVTMETKWTQKGRLFIYELLKSKDILPLIERENSAA